jgi:hypothetical protein
MFRTFYTLRGTQQPSSLLVIVSENVGIVVPCKSFAAAIDEHYSFSMRTTVFEVCLFLDTNKIF